MIYTRKQLILMLKEAHHEVLLLESDVDTKTAKIDSLLDENKRLTIHNDTLHKDLFNEKQKGKNKKTKMMEKNEEISSLKIRLDNQLDEISYHKELNEQYRTLPEIGKFVEMVTSLPTASTESAVKLLEASTPDNVGNNQFLQRGV